MKFKQSMTHLLIRKALFGGLLVCSLNAIADEAGSVQLKNLLQGVGADSELALSGLLQQSLESTELGGAFTHYKGSSLSPLSPQQLALQVLNKNLDLVINRADIELAIQAKKEAKAIFDPVLGIDFGVNRDESYERTVEGTVLQKVFEPQVGEGALPGEIVLPEGVQESTGIEKIRFQNTNAVENKEKQNQTVFASKDSPEGAQTVPELSFALQQITPWGINYDISLSSVSRDVAYDSKGHSFDAPWSSELLLNVSVPIGNNFGVDSSVAINKKVTEIDQQRKQWQLKRRINLVLKQATDTYLDLLQSATAYRIAIDNRKLSEEQQNNTARLYDARVATAYEKSQIDGEVSFAKSAEQSAAQAYLAVSDKLLALTSDRHEKIQGQILVPKDYTQWIAGELPINRETAAKTALNNRPILQDGMLAVSQSDVRLRNAALGTRPDITVTANLGLSQDGSVYGYDSLFSSWAEVLDPDVSTQTIAASYIYPLGNKAAKARKLQAEAGKQVSELQLQQSENQVMLEVNNALNNLASGSQLKLIAEQQLFAAEKAYKSISKRGSGGAVTQNEIITALRNLQSAKTSQLNAVIGYKRAEADLLAAQGTLEQTYAQWVARNDFESWRLAQLTTQVDFVFLSVTQ